MVVYKQKKKMNEDTNFWSNGQVQRKNKCEKESHIFLSNGCVQMKDIYQ